MKKLLIMCGSGIATSTVAAGKVKQWLKDNNLEDEVKSTRNDVKSILCYQEQKNALIESELEEMRNEVASCYEHFEVFSKEKEDGR